MKFLKKLLMFLRGNNECFFVGATDKLPPPLSKEKELEYLILAKKGDINARNILIEHNLRLVVFLAKKYENTGSERKPKTKRRHRQDVLCLYKRGESQGSRCGNHQCVSEKHQRLHGLRVLPWGRQWFLHTEG